MSSLLGGSQSPGGLDLSTLMSLATKQGQASEALSDLINQAGGLSGVLEKFQQAGLGDTASSWIGTGANQPIEGSQMESALGSAPIQDVATKLGLQHSQIVSLLAQFLPVIIDKLTPTGSVGDNQPSADTMQNVFASIIKGGFSSGKA
jgi:uncharacterized protein YidB (DUF937 family)